MPDRIPKFQPHLCPSKNHCPKLEATNQRQEDLKFAVSLGFLGESELLDSENKKIRQGLGRWFRCHGKVLTVQIPE